MMVKSRQAESFGTGDLNSLSTEQLARRYYELLEEKVKASLLSSKVLARFQTQDITLADKKIIHREYTRIKKEVISTSEITRIKKDVGSSEDALDLFELELPKKLIQERQLELKDIEYHILAGSSPEPQVIVDFLRGQPQVKDIKPT